MPRGNSQRLPKSLRTVGAKVSLDALEIERRYRDDVHFRSVCRDHADACAALERWQRTAGQDDRRTLDYRRLVDELELELLSILQRGGSQS
jgi:hypothetical protein